MCRLVQIVVFFYNQLTPLILFRVEFASEHRLAITLGYHQYLLELINLWHSWPRLETLRRHYFTVTLV